MLISKGFYLGREIISPCTISNCHTHLCWNIKLLNPIPITHSKAFNSNIFKRKHAVFVPWNCDVNGTVRACLLNNLIRRLSRSLVLTMMSTTEAGKNWMLHQYYLSYVHMTAHKIDLKSRRREDAVVVHSLSLSLSLTLYPSISAHKYAEGEKEREHLILATCSRISRVANNQTHWSQAASKFAFLSASHITLNDVHLEWKGKFPLCLWNGHECSSGILIERRSPFGLAVQI